VHSQVALALFQACSTTSELKAIYRSFGHLLTQPRYAGAEGNNKGPGEGQADGHPQVVIYKSQREAADFSPQPEIGEPGDQDEENPNHS
jgi:hypothetical protein